MNLDFTIQTKTDLKLALTCGSTFTIFICHHYYIAIAFSSVKKRTDLSGKRLNHVVSFSQQLPVNEVITIVSTPET